MQKMISVFLVTACMLCLLIGCAKPDPEPSTTCSSAPTQPSTTTTPPPTQPKGFEKTSINDGTYVLHNGARAVSALSERTDFGYAPFCNIRTADGTVAGYGATEVFTITNVEGGILLQDCYGRYMYMTGPNNSFSVSAEMPAEGHIWTLYVLDGVYKLVNNSNGKTLCYSTSYTSWGCYSKIDSDRNPVLYIAESNAQ